MPGILGIISKSDKSDRMKELRIMIECMRYEKFYSHGQYAKPENGIYLGWVNYENSFSDCNPIKTKNTMLIFSGENFAGRSVQDELNTRGYKFSPQNAEYVMAMYEVYGEDFLEKLNGWFSGVLVDSEKEKILLFNDRLGLERIYYYEDDTAFWFASEAKSLLKILPKLREINPSALSQYLNYGAVFDNETIFSEIKTLPGGSVFEFSGRKLTKKAKYFEPSQWENQSKLGYKDFFETFLHTFKEILPKYIDERLKTAISLTGGLDSRLILSCLDFDREIPFYTYGGASKECLDVAIARKLAEYLSQPYNVINLDARFLQDFGSLASRVIYITDGNMGITGSHDLYLNSYAKEIAPIRLTGKFGSEVIRGVSTFKNKNIDHRIFSEKFSTLVENSRINLKDLSHDEMLTFTLFTDIPLNEYGRLKTEQSQIIFRSPYLDNELIKLMYRAPEDIRLASPFMLDLIRAYSPDILKIRTDMGYGGDSNPLFSKIISIYRKILFKLEWYFNEGMPDNLSKVNEIAKFLRLDSRFVGTNKIEDYRKWYRNELNNYISEIILDERTLNRDYWDKDYISEIPERHKRGERNLLTEINQIVNVELIHRVLLES